LEGGGHFFSKGGAVVSKKYFLGSIRGNTRADKHGKKNAFLRVKSAHFNAFETRFSKKKFRFFVVFYQKTRLKCVILNA
jgi:hypothetical protein